MTEVKTFEEARKLAIDKWEKILVKISELEYLMGAECGFCFLSEYKCKTSMYFKCAHCLVENKCDEYKETMQNTLCKLELWIEENLIPWLHKAKENELTSRHQLKEDE